jgi:hypothetical protein
LVLEPPLHTHIKIFAMKCISLVCRIVCNHHLCGLQNNISNSLLISGDVYSSFWSTQIRCYNWITTQLNEGTDNTSQFRSIHTSVNVMLSPTR